tara:strand:+ start:1138 stop:1911 length:774 start_codon:yes stop_codon:yes gene_type:complete
MTKAVAKKKGGEVVEFDPALFEADAGVGAQMEQEDLALPFLKIISALDPILDDDDFTGRKGDIVNTVSGQVYSGKEGVTVIPCAYQRRFIQWAPRGQGTGAPQAIYTPQEKRPETKRDENDNKEYVVGGDGEYVEETHQHFVIIVNDDGSAETALIAMKSTQLKKSRKWNSMVASLTMQGANGPFTPARFSHTYHLKTLSEENSKGSWHGWEMSRIGPVKDAALYQQAKQFAESIMAGDVVVKHGDDEEDKSNNPAF